MERTKYNNARLAPIISDFLRVGMWPITNPVRGVVNSETGIKERVYKYGDCIIIVSGELFEKDRGTFLLIQSLEKRNNFKGIEGNIVDLVKAKGVKNFYQPSSIDPLWKSIENLLDVHVRIKPLKKGVGLSAAFKLVTGEIDSSGDFFLTTHDYQQLVKRHSLYELNVPLNVYNTTKSPITRSLREFIRTQKIPKSGYCITLKKLCKYIGYNAKLPTYKIWQVINKSLQELIKEAFIGKMTFRSLNKCKDEGGLITIYPPIKIPKIKTAKEINDEIILYVKEATKDKPFIDTEIRYKKHFNDLDAFLKKNYHKVTLKFFIHNYAGWLNNRKDINYISAALFRTENTFLKRYINFLRDENKLETLAEYAERN